MSSATPPPTPAAIIHTGTAADPGASGACSVGGGGGDGGDGGGKCSADHTSIWAVPSD